MDFTVCDISFGRGIVLLRVQRISFFIQAESNECKLVNIY
jgi:hypothetical protein